jgi:hypothetical protein
MKAIEPGVQGQDFTLAQVRLKFIVEFKLPQSEKQALSELWEIQQREGESAWEYSQKFKDVIGRLVHPIHEDHQREWYIQGLLPLMRIPLTQQWIATLTDALEQVDEDRSHGRISRESESDQTSSGCKFVTTPGTNIDTNGEYSRINYTKTRMTSSLVHRMLHRGASGK